MQTLSARGLAFVTEKRYILLRCRGKALVQLWPRLLLVTYNSCNMELEDFFNECVTMVADRVTNEILKRLATVEEAFSMVSIFPYLMARRAVMTFVILAG